MLDKRERERDREGFLGLLSLSKSNKKRNPTRSPHSLMSAMSLSAASPPCDPTAEIKSECERSLTELRRGNPTKALQLICDALGKHRDAALVHRVHGEVHAQLTAMMEDPVVKQRHLKAAIDSAQRSTELAPNSIEFAHFYASLLFEYMDESEGYLLPLFECNRALCVEDPVDPAEELLHVTEDTAASTPEARINQVQGEIRNLLQKWYVIGVQCAHPGQSPSDTSCEDKHFPAAASSSSTPSGLYPHHRSAHSSMSTVSPAAALPLCNPTPKIKSECERSLTALRHGNPTKALQLICDTLGKHRDSALVHRVHSMVHAELTSMAVDPVVKERHLKAAIDSAQMATELAPNSIEFAHFYASLLFDYMAESERYEFAVVAEYNRALCVKNPVDPAEESLHVSEETAASTPEARINQVKEEIWNLMQKCVVASKSSWMKPKTVGELVKASETLDGRKELAVWIAAGKILQQHKSCAAASSSSFPSRRRKGIPLVPAEFEPEEEEVIPD